MSAGDPGERWNCQFQWCNAKPLINKDGSLRAHDYEVEHPCPGSGFNIRKPSGEEHRKMQERHEQWLVSHGFAVVVEEDENG